ACSGVCSSAWACTTPPRSSPPPSSWVWWRSSPAACPPGGRRGSIRWWPCARSDSMTKAAPLKRPEAILLRAFALGFPEAYEEFPWGERVAKVNGKVFVFLGMDGDTLGLSVKLPQSGMLALGLPFASPTGYGLGKAGWVTA